MLELILIAIFTLLASLLTFYSGFGLGTILMPIMAIFIPVPLAIVLTAIVHLVHNGLKTLFLWQSIDWQILLKFGSVAVMAAVPGAWLLNTLSFLPEITSYSFWGITAQMTILKIIIGLLLLLIATVELLPMMKFFQIRNFAIGGAISGFLGGLSGNQGAFRSIFLVSITKNKDSFLASSACIAVVVDIVRLLIYGISLTSFFYQINPWFITAALGGATLGVFIGLTLRQKITILTIQKVIIILLYILGILMLLGFI